MLPHKWTMSRLCVSDPHLVLATEAETLDEENEMSELKNNAYVLVQALDQTSYAVVRDGHHRGTLFAWTGEVWLVCDLEDMRSTRREAKRIAVVTLHNEADADSGLNQACLGCDLEAGEWVLDADDIAEMRVAYEDDLESLWEQPGTPEDLLRELSTDDELTAK